ncbi:GatB/YqeY domain-containing protein [uncultured Enterococcus sp.]|uniref:GatB/YqeY domain-containing protein n=1 Tax=uncultured Enterococcus sp. TaxID=167972 RepID=UPI002AA63E5F|nr:GatB/YqeY domain-containing protein [uncultured Enterococcus sp.]
MSLLTTLNDDIKTAMKAKDKETLSVLRMLKSGVQNEQIKMNRDLNGEEELVVLSREMKQRKDSLLEFEKAGREDLADKAKFEITIVEKYLPEKLTEDELREIIQSAISESGAASPAEFGKVMGLIMPKILGRADGNSASAIVKEMLQKN